MKPLSKHLNKLSDEERLIIKMMTSGWTKNEEITAINPKYKNNTTRITRKLNNHGYSFEVRTAASGLFTLFSEYRITNKSDTHRGKTVHLEPANSDYPEPDAGGALHLLRSIDKHHAKILQYMMCTGFVCSKELREKFNITQAIVLNTIHKANLSGLCEFVTYRRHNSVTSGDYYYKIIKVNPSLHNFELFEKHLKALIEMFREPDEPEAQKLPRIINQIFCGAPVYANGFSNGGDRLVSSRC